MSGLVQLSRSSRPPPRVCDWVVVVGAAVVGLAFDPLRKEELVLVGVPHMAASFLAFAMLARSAPLPELLAGLLWRPALLLAVDQREPNASPPVPPTPLWLGLAVGLPSEAAVRAPANPGEEKELCFAPLRLDSPGFTERLLEMGALPAWIVEEELLTDDWKEVK
jgi:hypothetical protein